MNELALDEIDVAVMNLAERVVDDATSIGAADLQPLRELGLSEPEIMDVILAAAARCFFAKTLDDPGVGIERPAVRERLAHGVVERHPLEGHQLRDAVVLHDDLVDHRVDQRPARGGVDVGDEAEPVRGQLRREQRHRDDDQGPVLDVGDPLLPGAQCIGRSP